MKDHTFVEVFTREEANELLLHGWLLQSLNDLIQNLATHEDPVILAIKELVGNQIDKLTPLIKILDTRLTDIILAENKAGGGR